MFSTIMGRLKKHAKRHAEYDIAGARALPASWRRSAPAGRGSQAALPGRRGAQAQSSGCLQGVCLNSFSAAVPLVLFLHHQLEAVGASILCFSRMDWLKRCACRFFEAKSAMPSHHRCKGVQEEQQYLSPTVQSHCNPSDQSLQEKHLATRLMMNTVSGALV